MKTSSNFFLLLLFLLFFALSCQKSVRNIEDLQEYIQRPQNGLVKEKGIDDLQLRLSYRPDDLLVVQELSQHAKQAKFVDSLRKKYAPYAYFDLQMAYKGGEIESYLAHHTQSFGTGIQTLAFSMGQQLLLKNDQRDTIELYDYRYQRTFGAGAATQLLFVYPADEIRQSKWIEFELADIGLGVGPQQFRFDIEDLRNCPQVSFKNIEN